MGTLSLLFTLAVLAYSIYSAIVYFSRRSGNRQALRAHQEGSAPLRMLTADERAALQPFLAHPTKPQQSLQLSREGVFLLEGRYVRHGLATQGGETMHDTIDGVDVIFPYDARDFIAEYCKAEVVFLEKVAIVVGLDGGFDLLGGRERTQARERQNSQWSSGRPGTVAEMPDEPEPGVEAGGPRAGEARPGLQVEILSQRDETPAEVVARSSPGLGLLPALLLVLGFIGLFIAGTLPTPVRLFWLVPALLCWLAALVFVWRKRGAGAPQKVNRVRGELHAIALPVNGTIDPAATQLFIGDKFALKFPEHWRAHVLRAGPGPADVEMRVSDFSAVRFDHRLSVDEEVRRWPPIHWGRHLILALVGLLAGLSLILFAGGVRSDLLLSWAWARQVAGVTAPTAAALAAAPPPAGSIVHLSGQARCEVRPGSGTLQVDCSRLRWGGATPRASLAEPDDLSRALYSGQFIQARSDPRIDMILQLQRASRGSDINQLLSGIQASRNAPKVVSGLPALIGTVRAACEPAAGATPEAARELQSRCEAWQRSLVGGLNATQDQPREWAAWVELADSGALVGENGLALVPAGAVSDITRIGKELANARIETRRSQIAQEILNTQRDGVVLQVWPGGDARSGSHPAAESDAMEALTELAALTTPDSLQDFSIDGLVTRAGSEPAGAPVVDIDTSRSLADPLPSLLRSLSLAVALLLVAVHGALFFRNRAAAAAREEAVRTYDEQRMTQASFPG